MSKLKFSNIQNGLTLIEVMIALVILSLSLTALIKAITLNVSNTNNLKNKVTASLVAKYSLDQIQLNLVKINQPPTTIKRTIQMFNTEWLWDANITNTNTPAVARVVITVRKNNNKHSPLFRLTGYKILHT